MARYCVDLVSNGDSIQERFVIDAESELHAAQLALQRGVVPIAITPLRGGLWDWMQNPIRGRRGIRVDSLALFSEQMSELLFAGLPLDQGLRLLGAQDAGSAQAQLADRLLRRICTGESLSNALREESGISAVFIGIVQGAERSGDLAAGFSTLAQYLERQNQIARKIRAALTYPAVVLLISLFAVFFILGVVIPEFAPLFAGEERRLPLITQVVLFLSDSLVNHFTLLLVVFSGIGVVCFWCVSSISAAQLFLKKLLLHFPPMQYALRLELARTIQVLGALLSSGVEASEAMDLAAAVPTNKAIRQQFIDGARSLREGRSVVEAFSRMPYLPQSIATLIAVGEQSGDLGRAVTRSASILEVDTNRRIDRFLALLNPTAVILLGGFVALLIASVMLGILSINQLALR